VAAQGTGASTRAYTGTPGHSYCFTGEAIDLALNQTRGKQCTTLPFKATQLTSPAIGWAQHADKRAYFGHYWRATQVKSGGLQLQLVDQNASFGHASRIVLVATTCPTCGKVEVLVSPTDGGALNQHELDKTISLRGRTTRHQQVIPVAKFKTESSPLRKYVILRSAGGGKVDIEGIGASALP
jgi:hypothetical protein